MASHTREREAKFLIEPTRQPPDLGHAPSVSRLGDPVEVSLDSTYFDTDDRRLADRRITLRRRTGSTDEGWQLKLPTPSGPRDRIEVGVPLEAAETRTSVPDELLQEVRAFVRDHEVGPIASVHTDRTERHLFDGEGRDLAVAADDIVHSHQLLGGPVELSSWRELEVELVNGDDTLLDEVERLLEDAGFDRSPFPSKLHHALGARVDTAGAEANPVADYLGAQVDELLLHDADVRADRPDGVHKMRVATRRLRTTMATFRPMLDAEVTEPLRAELKWLGTVLGGARDAEVQRERLTAAARELPVELRVGPVVDRIDTELGRRHRASHALLTEALESGRYFALLDQLDALVDRPPFVTSPDQQTDQIRRRVRHSVKRVRRAARAVTDTSGAERTRALHEVRKAAKRSRYAAEAARPVLGSKSKKLARRMEALQELLGEVQDSVTSQAILRQLGMSTAHVDTENGFTFGVLHERQQAAADAATAEAPRLLRRATRGW
jgi:CHAD domain-containing protein